MSITPEERRALLFLGFLLLAGSLVRLAQSVSPDWTPDLKPLGRTAGAAADTGLAGTRTAAVAAGGTAARSAQGAPAAGAGGGGSDSASNSAGAALASIADQPAPASPYRAGRLDLNAATAKDLAELPGIGEKLASRIVADREARGPFASVEDLKRVPGIGPAKLARMQDGVFVAPDRAPR